MTTVDEIVSRWRSEKLDLMPGVTLLRFKEFEDKLAISLPQSFRQVCFGDYLIDSHRYYLQLSESAGEGSIVIR